MLGIQRTTVVDAARHLKSLGAVHYTRGSIEVRCGPFCRVVDGVMLHTGLSDAPAFRRLDAFFQIDTEHQRRIGTLVVLCSMIERDLEILCWVLAGQDPAAGVATTEKAPASELVQRLRTGAAAIENAKLANFLIEAAETTTDLLEIRNTVVHGRPMVGADGAPSLARNPSWFGETRRRPAGALPVSNDVLDLAAEIALTTNLVIAGFQAV